MSLNYDSLINKLGITSEKKCNINGSEKPCGTSVFRTVQKIESQTNSSLEKDKKKKNQVIIYLWKKIKRKKDQVIIHF